MTLSCRRREENSRPVIKSEQFLCELDRLFHLLEIRVYPEIFSFEILLLLVEVYCNIVDERTYSVATQTVTATVDHWLPTRRIDDRLHPRISSLVIAQYWVLLS